jgi:hypothetical protein
MATIVVLKNKETGKERALYSALAREVLAGPNAEKWEFVRRLERTARMMEGTGTAAVKTGEAGAVEFHGEARVQEDARKAVTPTEPAAVAVNDAIAGKSEEGTFPGKTDEDSPLVLETTGALPQTPRGSRGGGKQEPAKAKPDDR